MQGEKHFSDGAVYRNRVGKIVHKWRNSFLFLCVELPFKTTRIALSAYVLHHFILVLGSSLRKLGHRWCKTHRCKEGSHGGMLE